MVTWGKALTKTRQGFFSKVSSMLLGKRSIEAADIEEIEETLLGADVPVRLVGELIDQLEGGRHDRTKSPVEILKTILLDSLAEPVEVDWRRARRPVSVLIVGINGTGKTTTTAKLAQRVLTQGLRPVLGAADTFRAAGSEQLRLWGDRIGCRVVTGRQGGDSSAVAFDAVQAALNDDADVVIVDTAGRMHTRGPLMEELKKVRGALDKCHAGAPDETWVVLDATQGQNTLQQARVFNEMVPLTGAIVTKLDGSSKAGFLFAINSELKIPILFAGLGEGEHDLIPFNPTEFVTALIAAKEEQ